MSGTEKIERDVAEYGWSVMKVSNDRGPDFAYSIGLYRTFEHPELLMFGLPLDTMHNLINDAAALIREGSRFHDGVMSDALLEGFEVTFRAVPPFQYPGHLGWAMEFYGGADFPALQLIYPDRTGAWPWQEEAPDTFRANQPTLADIGIPDWAR